MSNSQSKNPTRAFNTPAHRRRSAPSCNAMVSMGPICDKKQARLGSKTGTETKSSRVRSFS